MGHCALDSAIRTLQVRHGDDVWHCADRAEVARLLGGQGLDLCPLRRDRLRRGRCEWCRTCWPRPLAPMLSVPRQWHRRVPPVAASS